MDKSKHPKSPESESGSDGFKAAERFAERFKEVDGFKESDRFNAADRLDQIDRLNQSSPSNGFSDSNEYAESYDLDEPEDVEFPPRRTPLVYRLVAFLTVLFFIALIGVNVWPKFNQPKAKLIAGSAELKEVIDSQLLEAVVQIEVLARKPGSLLALEQKRGTGFNIAPNGVIVTNQHVVAEAEKITIRFPDGKMYAAKDWRSKPEFDLALVTLEAADLPVAQLNQQSQPLPGDPVLVVGNPLGLKNIAIEGEVDRYLKLKDQPEKVFSIKAPIYPGNSGSPVYDQNGEVIGVVFASLKRETEDPEQIRGLAIPVQEILNWQ